MFGYSGKSGNWVGEVSEALFCQLGEAGSEMVVFDRLGDYRFSGGDNGGLLCDVGFMERIRQRLDDGYGPIIAGVNGSSFVGFELNEDAGSRLYAVVLFDNLRFGGCGDIGGLVEVLVNQFVYLANCVISRSVREIEAVLN